MKTLLNKAPRSLPFFTKGSLRTISAALTLALCSSQSWAEEYEWTLSGTGDWATPGNWSPEAPEGGPGAGDSVKLSTSIEAAPTTRLNGLSVTIDSLTRPAEASASFIWVIGNNSATASVLNVGSISNHASTTIIRNLTSTGISEKNFTVNVDYVNLTAGSLYFGAQSNAAGQFLSDLNVTTKTTVSGGNLLLNIQNQNDIPNSFTLGELAVNGGNVVLANRPKASSSAAYAVVTGLSGSGGNIQAGTGTNDNGNQNATLVINNENDYSSRTLLRDHNGSHSNPGILTLIKYGSGTQTLTANNTYTGGTTIYEGTLQIGDGGSSGSIVGDVHLAGENAVFAINRSNAGEFSGNITGSGSLVKRGNGTWVLSGNNTYSGGTTIEGGAIKISQDSNLGDPSTDVVFNNGSNVAQLQFSQSMSTSRNIIINGDIARLSTESEGTVVTLHGQILGTGALDKRFVGALVVTQPSTYLGGTIITTGLFIAQNVTGSATGSGAVTIGGASTIGTLGGSGIIAPNAGNSVTVTANGIISPGFGSEDTLRFNLSDDSKLIFDEGSTIQMTLGSTSDKISFLNTGDWLAGSGNATLSITLGEGFTFGEYVIFENVTTPDFTFAEITGLDSYNYSFGLVGTNYVLTVAVPEPSTWALLGLGGLAVVYGLRRRTKANAA